MIIEMFIVVLILAGLTIYTERSMKKQLARVESETEENKRQADAAIKEKENEIRKLTEQLAQLGSKEKEHLGTRAEIERLKSALNDEVEEVKNKENEIKRLNDELVRLDTEQKELEQRVAELKKVESDLLWLEKELNEQKKSAHEMKQRIEEGRIKAQLLNEKTKENVELIASFAEGKEFDEFRSSVHLDEIIRKYESEIRDLKIKNMDLKKKLGMEESGGGVC